MMKKEYLYASVAIFCWSTTAMTTKLLLGSLNNIQLLWMNSFFAGMALLVMCLMKGSLGKLRQYRARDYLIMALTGLPGTFVYYVLYYAGTNLMPASQALIVNYLWPIMSIVFACVLLKEKMTVRTIAAVIISFAGVAIAMCGSQTELSSRFLLGALFCLLDAVSYGLYTALTQKIHHDKHVMLMVSFFTTFLLTSVINFVTGDLYLPTAAQAAGMAWNGIFAMALAAIMWVRALELGKTEKISNLAYITPFLSLIWTSLVLKEPFSVFNILGLLVIVLGILVQFREKRGKAEDSFAASS